MKKRNMTRTRQDQNSGRKAIYSKYFLLTSLCGVALVASFFFAARQHFSSIDYSMQNSKLKRQVEDLESAKRSLIIAKETSLSPAEIKRAAKKMGFFEIDETTTLKPASQVAAETVRLTNSPAAKTAQMPKLVQKTVQTSMITSAERPKTAEKSKKRDPLARDRRVQTDRR